MVKLLVTVPCKEHIVHRFRQEFGHRLEITFANEDRRIIAEAIGQAQVIIGEPEPSLLSLAKNLQWMQITWAGADRFAKVFPRHATLTNTSGVFGRIISEYTLGMILSRYKRLPEYYVNQKSKLWQDLGSERSLLGAKVLILGTGNVGSSIAQKLQAFGCHVTGINRTGRAAAHFDSIHTLTQLDALLPNADIVIGALPKTGGTVGLLDGRRLRLIKEDAMLVNVGRGTMIVTTELEAAVAEGRFSDVILDVTDPEPLPESSLLWSCPRVLLTPHISGIGFDHEPQTEAQIWDICFENLRRFLQQQPLTHVVDLQEGY